MQQQGQNPKDDCPTTPRAPGKNLAPAWLEVDLDKIGNNIRKLKAAAGPGVKVLAMVKAQAYGCGAAMISQVALENGAEMLGVANIAEALALRNSGLRCPILVFGRPDESELGAIIEEDLLQTVFDSMLARQLDRAAGTAGKKVRVHLKIDTGMGRLGLLPGEMDDFLDGFASCPNLVLDGVYTHFPVADCDTRFTREQLETFATLLNKVRERGYSAEHVHVANSAALLNPALRRGETFGIVRPGISIYGLYGSPLVSREINLEEVVSFKARVVHVKKVPPGTSVSYGREFIALRDTTIATIAAGYADGVPFRLAKKGDVLIHGRRFPIVGRVTMDMTMADVGESNDIAVGDVAVFFGESGRAHISVSEVAEKSGTIEHEVICGIGPRVPRVYLKDGNVACIQRYTFG